jgi:WD40 repeat protein
MSVAVSPDGERVASAGADGAVRLWRSSDLTPLAATATQRASVNDVTFTPSGELVTAGNDGVVRFWRTDGSPTGHVLVADPAGDALRSVAVSPDGATLAAATADGVRLFDVANGKERGPLNSQPAEPLDVVFSPDGQWFVSVSRDGRVALWDTATRAGLGPRFSYHQGAVWHAAITQGSVVVTAGEDGTVRSLDVLDIGKACALGAGALDDRALEQYLSGAKPIGCRR